jgi:hypothetical protein
VESSLGRIEVDNFFRNNFEMWKLEMGNLLINQDMWDVVDDNISRLADPTQVSQYDVMDHKAKGLIILFLEKSDLINFHEETSTQKIWKKIGEMYQAKYLVNKIFLMKKFHSLRMEEG